MKNLHTIVVLFLSLTILVFGCTRPEDTGTLYGTVTDQTTGSPISAASVELQPTGLITTTGADGWYQFSDVKVGEYEVSISKIGYDIVKKSGIQVSSGPVRYDVTLVHIPSFEYNGHIYMVAPDAGEVMTLTEANSYCQELTQYGYSDWRLPTITELSQMYTDKQQIGGFRDKVYWSSTQNTIDHYYVVHFLNGNMADAHISSKLRVRPIRIEN